MNTETNDHAHTQVESSVSNTHNNNINCRITRKLEGGRPHKVYDYMFIQMSNEQFKSEYEQKKIFIYKSPKDEEVEN